MAQQLRCLTEAALEFSAFRAAAGVTEECATPGAGEGGSGTQSLFDLYQDGTLSACRCLFVFYPPLSFLNNSPASFGAKKK